MIMQFQQTIRKPVTCSGVGLHSGCRVSVTLMPAPLDTGIVFIRKDISGSPKIQVSIENIRPALLSTTVGIDGVQVQTIEHMLAAASGLGIDNLLVEIDAPELPALDGSAQSFVSLMLEAGVVSQDRRRSYLKVVRPIPGEVLDPGLHDLPGERHGLRTFKLFWALGGPGSQSSRCLTVAGQVHVKELPQTLQLPQAQLQHGAKFKEKARGQIDRSEGKQPRSIEGCGGQISASLGVADNGAQ